MNAAPDPQDLYAAMLRRSADETRRAMIAAELMDNIRVLPCGKIIETHKRTDPCILAGVTYASQRHAAEALGISRSSVKGRIARIKARTSRDDAP